MVKIAGSCLENAWQEEYGSNVLTSSRLWSSSRSASCFSLCNLPSRLASRVCPLILFKVAEMGMVHLALSLWASSCVFKLLPFLLTMSSCANVNLPERDCFISVVTLLFFATWWTSFCSILLQICFMLHMMAVILVVIYLEPKVFLPCIGKNTGLDFCFL